jgi:hypothetical protein
MPAGGWSVHNIAKLEFLNVNVTAAEFVHIKCDLIKLRLKHILIDRLEPGIAPEIVSCYRQRTWRWIRFDYIAISHSDPCISTPAS